MRSRPLPGWLLSCVVVASGSSISNSISGSMSGCRCSSCSSRASNSAWFFSLNRATRALTIIVSSGQFLCHFYSSYCTFACHVSWPYYIITSRLIGRVSPRYSNNWAKPCLSSQIFGQTLIVSTRFATTCYPNAPGLSKCNLRCFGECHIPCRRSCLTPAPKTPGTPTRAAERQIIAGIPRTGSSTPAPPLANGPELCIRVRSRAKARPRNCSGMICIRSVWAEPAADGYVFFVRVRLAGSVDSGQGQGKGGIREGIDVSCGFLLGIISLHHFDARCQ